MRAKASATCMPLTRTTSAITWTLISSPNSMSRPHVTRPAVPLGRARKAHAGGRNVFEVGLPYIAAPTHQDRGLAHHPCVPDVRVGRRIRFVVVRHVQHSPVTSHIALRRARVTADIHELLLFMKQVTGQDSATGTGLGALSALL